jgi:hypothetical protein
LGEDGAITGLPPRLGGRLCLDFANTVEPRMSLEAVDYLAGYSDLVAWSVHAEAVDETTAELLLKEAERRPAAAAATFAWAIAVGEAV